MVKKIQANYTSLNAAGALFNQHAESLTNLEQTVKQQVAKLQGGDWVGTGARQFFEEMGTLVFPAVRRLIGAMREGNQYTKRLIQLLSDAETEAANLFKGGSSGFESGTDLGFDPGEAAKREIETLEDAQLVPQADVTNHIRGLLPQVGALIKNTQTGKSLLNDAIAANVRFDFSALGIPGLTTMGSTAKDAHVITYRFDQGMGTAAGSFSSSNQNITISLYPYRFKTTLTAPELANTLAHEMQHAVDDHTPGLMPHKFPTPNELFNPTTLTKKFADWIEDQTLTEVRAHLRGHLLQAEASGNELELSAYRLLPRDYRATHPLGDFDRDYGAFAMPEDDIGAIANGIKNIGSFFDTSRDQRIFVLNDRGYAESYRKSIQDIINIGGHYSVAVVVNGSGNLGVGVRKL